MAGRIVLLLVAAGMACWAAGARADDDNNNYGNDLGAQMKQQRQDEMDYRLHHPHVTKSVDGDRCNVDSNCMSRKCRAFPDGNTYCVAEEMRCAIPGASGAKTDSAIKMGSQCYQCVAQMGWRTCKADMDTAQQDQGAGQSQSRRVGMDNGTAQGGGLGQTTQQQNGRLGLYQPDNTDTWRGHSAGQR